MNKHFKWIDFVLQAIGILSFIIVGFQGKEFISSIVEPIGIGLFVFISLIQVISFFVYHFRYPETRKTKLRKVFKWGFITHHLLILPSALLYYIPLFFTSSFLILFYFLITTIELFQNENAH